MGNSCCRVHERDCIIEESQRMPIHPEQKQISIKSNGVLRNQKEEESGCMKECMEKEGGDERGLVRVKILVTKQELALLLSNKNNEEIFESIAKEIEEKARHNRISVKSDNIDRRRSCDGSWRPLLDSIPEDC
ncbi:hypothetical protein QJS04_geneDACA011053 [Acorus gramineus]|uniref:Uncharacterized protein n=1 Tax=Acorus gramineus TaxID=55184 RepID=A0AAV9BEJ6_ACOGR|nr:hypothetical protein QJS04_geneDACA011053 [Acorus gramineus]